jgi:hypothetical protein
MRIFSLIMNKIHVRVPKMTTKVATVSNLDVLTILDQSCVLCPKLDAHDLVTYLNPTLAFEWYVVWCGSKNIYHKQMFLKEVGIHAQKT